MPDFPSPSSTRTIRRDYEPYSLLDNPLDATDNDTSRHHSPAFAHPPNAPI